jgi:DNA topoisomerase-1
MLAHSTDKEPGISRKGAGTGFYYVDSDNKKVTDKSVLDRIRSLAIPPAYEDVWICPLEDGHLQVTGRDDRQRKQYIYHPEWHQLQKLEKFDRQIEVGNGYSSACSNDKGWL